MSYKERDKILAQIGYSSYSEYLRSSLWQQIKRRKLELARFRCRVCGEHAHILHHVSYDIAVLQGRNLKKLVPLCGLHHAAIELRSDGSKTSHQEANHNLNLLLGTHKVQSKKVKRKSKRWIRFHPKKGRCHSFR